jgi:hypothetical protein
VTFRAATSANAAGPRRSQPAAGLRAPRQFGLNPGRDLLAPKPRPFSSFKLSQSRQQPVDQICFHAITMAKTHTRAAPGAGSAPPSDVTHSAPYRSEAIVAIP